ncbi:hypothetical protein CI109_103451 [Kwoniella shandongensis]|uniref:Uncharacterized protein n=1 Tax=Kwoniella shandongensis TaxID=1734106 RepID=A0A5M6BY31_9TREE|nr:uncharacterized protein CI109_004646 [Kwoniella shandongensis]KAA5527110.1 hypothetical protein CI109_004646 [Kwoniella shandongensis]
MTSRLPSRGYTNLVELGFLLPWAARALSGSSRSATKTSEAVGRPSLEQPWASSSTLTSDQGSSSTNQLNRTRLRQRRPLLPPTYPKSPRPAILEEMPHLESPTLRSSLTSSSSSSTSIPKSPKPNSVIHHALSFPNPPPASDLFITLRAHPAHLTLTSGTLLAHYARRTGDMKTEREIYRLMNQRRISPLERGGLRSKGKQRMGTGEDEPDPYSIHSMPSSDSTKRKYTIRPNRWAMKAFPPIDKLASRTYTTVELLRHLHHLILEGEPPDFGEAMGLLDTTTDSSGSKAEEGENGKKDGYGGLKMLHLYLAYTPRPTHPTHDPLDLLSTYQAQFSQLPNRQTLHLIVLSILSSTTPSPTKSPVNPDDAPPLSKSTPEEYDEQINLLLATISLFQRRYRLSPGPETWRHIALHSTRHDLPALAQIAWEGWYAAIRKMEDGGIGPDEERKGGGMGKKDEEEVRIRFKRLGTMKRRWSRAMAIMEEKGWVTKSDEETEDENWGYRWIRGSKTDQHVQVEHPSQNPISAVRDEEIITTDSPAASELRQKTATVEAESNTNSIADIGTKTAMTIGPTSNFSFPTTTRPARTSPTLHELDFAIPHTTSFTTTYEDPSDQEPILARATG